MDRHDLTAVFAGLDAFDRIEPGFSSNSMCATLGPYIRFIANVTGIGPFQCLKLRFTDHDGEWRVCESAARIVDPTDPDDTVDWMRGTIGEWLPSARRRARLHDLDELLDGLSDGGVTKVGDLYLLGDLMLQPLDDGLLAIHGRTVTLLPDRDGKPDADGLRRIIEDTRKGSIR